MSGNKTIAIIVAAGRGERMGGTDKIFAGLAGKPVLAHALGTFQKSVLIDGIVVAVRRENIERARSLVLEYRCSKVTSICAGGKERWQSVAAGLERIDGASWVLIHDGARPLVSGELIAAGLKAAEETGAAVPAVPITDTVKSVDAGSFVDETLQREKLRVVQTPQVFRPDIIARAYQNIRAGDNPTDDASLVERLGCRVKVFPGSFNNIKITTPADMALAEILLRGGK